MLEAKTLYESDAGLWSQQQAAALRAGDWAALDIDNLADEVASLNISLRRAVASHFEILIEHILKLQAFPNDRSARLWGLSVRNAAREIVMLLAQAPSLRNIVDDAVADAYDRAIPLLGEHMGIELPDEFPATLRPAIDAALGDATTRPRTRRE